LVTKDTKSEVVGKSNIIAESNVSNMTLWSICGKLFQAWYQLIR